MAVRTDLPKGSEHMKHSVLALNAFEVRQPFTSSSSIESSLRVLVLSSPVLKVVLFLFFQTLQNCRAQIVDCGSCFSSSYNRSNLKMKISFVLPFLLGLAASQAHTPQCGAPTNNNWPSLTMQFTPSMPIQKAPVSTVYGAIMTSYLNVSRLFC